MRRVLLVLAVGIFFAGLGVFVPSRLAAQKVCSCNSSCLLNDCSCTASAGAWVDCSCGCTWWGNAKCTCIGDP
jgi:hypothetical protein